MDEECRIAFERWERSVFDRMDIASRFPTIREIFHAGWEAHQGELDVLRGLPKEIGGEQ